MSNFDSLTAQLNTLSTTPDTGADTNVPAVSPPDDIEQQGDETAPPLTREEEAERKKLIRLAAVYLKQFPEKLEEFANQETYPLKEMSIEELQDTLDEMKQVLGETNAIGLYKSIANTGLTFAEQILTATTPLKLDGLSESLSSNKDWDDCVAELALEYGGLQYMPAKYRIFTLFAFAVQQKHAENTVLELERMKRSQPAVKDLTERFKDL